MTYYIVGLHRNGAQVVDHAANLHDAKELIRVYRRELGAAWHLSTHAWGTLPAHIRALLRLDPNR